MYHLNFSLTSSSTAKKSSTMCKGHNSVKSMSSLTKIKLDLELSKKRPLISQISVEYFLPIQIKSRKPQHDKHTDIQKKDQKGT
jgi:hypothetical protein